MLCCCLSPGNSLEKLGLIITYGPVHACVVAHSLMEVSQPALSLFMVDPHGSQGRCCGTPGG